MLNLVLAVSLNLVFAVLLNLVLGVSVCAGGRKCGAGWGGMGGALTSPPTFIAATPLPCMLNLFFGVAGGIKGGAGRGGEKVH